MIRKLADYMDLRGLNTHKPSIMIPVKPSDFTPHIYTDSELKRFFEQAGLLPFYPNCPNRGPVASLLFRMLYGCGLRISEALNLTMKDVDLDRGVLAILDSKFGKSRYVPMSPSLTERCRQYAAHIRSEAHADAPFFSCTRRWTLFREQFILLSGIFLKMPAFHIPDAVHESMTLDILFPFAASKNGSCLGRI